MTFISNQWTELAVSLSPWLFCTEIIPVPANSGLSFSNVVYTVRQYSFPLSTCCLWQPSVPQPQDGHFARKKGEEMVVVARQLLWLNPNKGLHRRNAHSTNTIRCFVVAQGPGMQVGKTRAFLLVPAVVGSPTGQGKGRGEGWMEQGEDNTVGQGVGRSGPGSILCPYFPPELISWGLKPCLKRKRF